MVRTNRGKLRRSVSHRRNSGKKKMIEPPKCHECGQERQLTVGQFIAERHELFQTAYKLLEGCVLQDDKPAFEEVLMLASWLGGINGDD
jgi:hypothetical protein